MRVTHLDLFSGIGGFALAAQWAGFETVAFCEIESFCLKVLNKHWPSVELFTDIRNISCFPRVDLVTAGFPCQPFSVAGKKKGSKDDRYLWPEVIRIIRVTRPTWFIGENVQGIISMLDPILEDLEREDYTWWAYLIPASLIGAPHKRDRLWIIANANSERCNHRTNTGKKRHIQNDIQRHLQAIQSEWSQFVPEPWASFNVEAWLSKSPYIGNDDGISHAVDRNKSLGNAIVPQVIYPILKMIRGFYE